MINSVSSRDLFVSSEIVFPGYNHIIPNPLVYTNASRFHDYGFSSWLHQGNITRRVEQQSVLLGRYAANTIVDAHQAFLVLTNGVLVREQVAPWIEGDLGLAQYLAECRLSGASTIAHPCLLASRYGETTWGHWLIDILPKVVVAEAAHPNLFTFIVPAHVTLPSGKRDYSSSVLESLAAYGIAPHRLLRMHNLTVLKFDNLFDIVGAVSDGMHPDALSLMRQAVNVVPSVDAVSHLATLRKPSDKRPVYNLGQVEGVLSENRYDLFDSSTLRFDDQVHLYSSAEYITADLGSNLASIIYAKRGVAITTLSPAGWVDGYFVNLFQRLQVAHADVRGASTFLDKSIADSPYVVPIEDLVAGLRAVAAPGIFEQSQARKELDGVFSPRFVGDEKLRLDFGLRENAVSFLVGSAWSNPEERHTWSLGKTSSIRIPRFPIGDFTIDGEFPGLVMEIKGISLLAPPTMSIRMLSVLANDRLMCDLQITHTVHRYVEIRPEVFENCADLLLEFKSNVSPSPREISDADDDRQLGFGFIHLVFRLCRSGYRNSVAIAKVGGSS